METLNLTASRRFGTLSPLRYPGGKASLGGLFADLIAGLNLQGATYVEPYAGGAGAGVALLRQGLIQRLVVNDFDPAVHAFWKAITCETTDFIKLVEQAPLTIETWKVQRDIYRASDGSDTLGLGFAFFYLNRTNRSGVLRGGVIGGLEQAGKYKIDARFNRRALISRIEAIGDLSDRITVTDLDGRTTIQQFKDAIDTFLYIDPPYVRAGQRLYLNAFDASDHVALAKVVNEISGAHWLMTYDVAPLIEKLYGEHAAFRYHLNYSARHPGVADELMIASKSVADLLPRVTEPRI